MLECLFNLLTFPEGIAIKNKSSAFVEMTLSLEASLHVTYSDYGNKVESSKPIKDASIEIFPDTQPNNKPVGIINPNVIFDLKPTKETKKIEATFANNRKEVNQLAGMFDDAAIIVDQKSNNIYSVVDGEKTVIAKNKTGEDLNKDIFGKNIKFIDSDKIINNVAATKNNFGSGVDINKLLKKFNEMEKTIGKLEKSNKSLQETVNALKTSGGSSENSDVDADAITGLKTRVSSLEDAVKLDPVKPASEKDAGINYYLNRNYDDIKSNYESIDSNYSLILQLQDNISSDYTTGLVGLDLLGMINSLTERVEALEG